MALAKVLTGRSLPYIGRHFNRDHTTVIHAVRKFQPLIDAIGATLGLASAPHEWASAARKALAEAKQ